MHLILLWDKKLEEATKITYLYYIFPSLEGVETTLIIILDDLVESRFHNQTRKRLILKQQIFFAVDESIPNLLREKETRVIKVNFCDIAL